MLRGVRSRRELPLTALWCRVDQVESVDVAELVRLCAHDSELYGRVFFPTTFRQESPPFAKDMWAPLEDPRERLVNLIQFRGGRKTTTLRTFASKRIAYGISRTILYIGASEADAIRSVVWLRNRVERNRFWAETFRLYPGRKWEETQIEIEHRGFGHTVWVLAAGMTGSLRGINFDDYRPDLIIVDDPQTDESAATKQAREKTSDLIFGAVRNSLAPESDEPNAKLAMAITPQHPEDISQLALKDPEFKTVVFPCWTKETMDLGLDQQVSSWEARFPTEVLRKQKRYAINRNRLSVFTREMECRLISKETAAFRPSWINIRPEGVIPPRGHFAILGIDPVPPPSDQQMAKGLEGKDWEAQYVWARINGAYELLESARNRGHEPSWSVATAFGLMRKWRCARCVFDAVSYQRTLKWIFEQEMRRRGVYFTVIPIADGMKKFARITAAVGGLASNGLLTVGAQESVFLEQFYAYGPTYSGHDDDLDASALALQDLSNPYLERADVLGSGFGDDVEDFPMIERCP